MKRLLPVFLIILGIIRVAKAQPLLTASDYLLITFLVLGAVLVTAMIILVISYHVRKKEKTASDPRISLLRKYFRESLDKGYNKKALIDAAIKRGWPKAIIESALKSL